MNRPCFLHLSKRLVAHATVLCGNTFLLMQTEERVFVWWGPVVWSWLGSSLEGPSEKESLYSVLGVTWEGGEEELECKPLKQ